MEEGGREGGREQDRAHFQSDLLHLRHPAGEATGYQTTKSPYLRTCMLVVSAMPRAIFEPPSVGTCASHGLSHGRWPSNPRASVTRCVVADGPHHPVHSYVRSATPPGLLCYPPSLLVLACYDTPCNLSNARLRDDL